MKLKTLVDIASKYPDTKVWDRIHGAELTIDSVYFQIEEMIKHNVPPEIIDQECDKYILFRGKGIENK